MTKYYQMQLTKSSVWLSFMVEMVALFLTMPPEQEAEGARVEIGVVWTLLPAA